MANKFITTLKNLFTNFPKKFKLMSGKERAAYGIIGLGFLFIIVAIILF
ncbi:hypothetical protein ACFLZB_02125 [Nanoarchaeota archaeon]